jgi:hypothetical protein
MTTTLIQWHPIKTAPQDRMLLLYAAGWLAEDATRQDGGEDRNQEAAPKPFRHLGP